MSAAMEVAKRTDLPSHVELFVTRDPRKCHIGRGRSVIQLCLSAGFVSENIDSDALPTQRSSCSISEDVLSQVSATRQLSSGPVDRKGASSDD